MDSLLNQLTAFKTENLKLKNDLETLNKSNIELLQDSQLS